MQLSDVVRIALIFSEDAKRYAKKLAGSIDLSGKADKKKPSKAGNLAALDASGNLTDSGKAGANVAVKAKPSKAGNLAALTADGSLSDSGIDPATKADLKDGKVAIKGWLETSQNTWETFFDQMQALGVRTMICTDISRDGAMEGTNRALYRTLAQRYSMDIIASGGVSSLEDIRALKAAGVAGAIIGKAYYTGAIDLAQAVRLYQGDYDQMTVYNADPAAQAREFIAAGAKYLHVVDLDGAKDDTTANMTTIAAIAKQSGLFIEVGGGIRDEARIEQYLSLGVGRCILGTIAVKDFDFTARMAQKYGPKIAVGVDMRDGLVAVNGWKEVTPEPGIAFCRRCAEAGVQAIIATDISRDGTMQGTNMDLYRELLQISGLEITASGGIARMEELAELQAMGCHAAILGKSIYTGAIDLKQAVALYQE